MFGEFDGAFYYKEGNVLDQTGRWTMRFEASGTGSVTFGFDLVTDGPTAAPPLGRTAPVAVTQAGKNAFQTVELYKGQ